MTSEASSGARARATTDRALSEHPLGPRLLAGRQFAQSPHPSERVSHALLVSVAACLHEQWPEQLLSVAHPFVVANQLIEQKLLLVVVVRRVEAQTDRLLKTAPAMGQSSCNGQFDAQPREHFHPSV